MGESGQEAISTKPRKPRWRRIAKPMVLALAALIVLAAAGWFIWNWLSASELDREIERIRAAGEPTTFAELAAGAGHVPKAKDAGPHYAAILADTMGAAGAWEPWDKLREETAKTTEDGTAPPAELLAEAKRLVELSRPALDNLDEAAGLPGYRYDLGFGSDGWSSWMDTAAQAHNLAKAVGLRTWLSAVRGQGDEAVDSTVSGLRMLRVVERQPNMTSHLTGMGAVAPLVDDVPLILGRTSPSAAALERLEDALRDAERAASLKQMWTAERVWQLHFYREILAGRMVPLFRNPSFLGRLKDWVTSRPQIRREAAKEMRLYAQYIAAAEKGFPEVLDAVTAGPRTSRRAPSFGSIAAWAGQTLARLRTARLAAMIERYQRENGKRPETLAELKAAGHEIPLDPFTGKELIYRRLPGEYVVYSVGPNRGDDGGTTLNQWGKGGDWGLRVRLRPPSTRPGP